MDYPMLNYLPSTIAASCVTVALWMLGKPTWTPTLTHYSGYAPRDLRHCAQVGALARERASVRAGCAGRGCPCCLALPVPINSVALPQPCPTSQLTSSCLLALP